MSIRFENTANKLRPQSFSELVGQSFVVSTLCGSIAKGHIAPAYLFSGPRGVGKTSAARLLALSINCPEGYSADDLNYEGSDEIRAGKSLDVIEIDGASYNSVENVRAIREEIMYAPVRFRYKVYIIDEVHMLSNSAFNALLKTIEEPPSYVVFIFATTEVDKVPATIHSRCQQFSFHLITLNEIVKKLEQHCTVNNITAEDGALQWIAKEAIGSLRDAYTLFDQIEAFSEKNITLDSIRKNLGLAGLDTLNQLFENCTAGKSKIVLEQIEELYSKGVSSDQLLLESAEYMRNQLLIKSGIISESILGFSQSQFSEKVRDILSVEQLEKALAMLLEIYRNVSVSIDQRFEIELLFVQMCSLSQYVTPNTLIKKLEAIKETILSNMVSVSDVYDTHKDESISKDKHTVNQENITPLLNNTHDTAAAHEHTESTASKFTLTSNEDDQPEQQMWRTIIQNIHKDDERLSLVLQSATVQLARNIFEICFNTQYGYHKCLEYAEQLRDLVQKKYGASVQLDVQLMESKEDKKNNFQFQTISSSDEKQSADKKSYPEYVQRVIDVMGGEVTEYDE